MSTVGIRELKAKLSEYLRMVKRGEVVRVTDRGKVVAEIRMPQPKTSPPSELAALRSLIERGVLTKGAPHDPSLYRRSPVHSPPGTARRLLDELREDRI